MVSFCVRLYLSGIIFLPIWYGRFICWIRPSMSARASIVSIRSEFILRSAGHSLASAAERFRYGSGVLMVLICLSTVFIKQHSIIDVVAAIILSIPLYLLAYRFDQIRDYFVQRRARRLSRDPA